ncbi:MAG: PIN domain-containing protein [Pseudomonadota bacterium]
MEPRKIFVDTSAWYALQVTDDANHSDAKRFFPRLLKKYQVFLTSNHVIGETYTLLRTSKGYVDARRFLEILGQSPRVERFFTVLQIEREAFELIHRYKDHPFSFVDGVSFCIMKREGIQDAFAFDSHFAIAGFNRVGIDSPL